MELLGSLDELDGIEELKLLELLELELLEELDEKDELEASKKNALEEVQFLKEKFPEYDGIFEAGLYDIETRKVSFLK